MFRHPLRQFYSRDKCGIGNLFVRGIETEIYPVRHAIVIWCIYGGIFIMKLESNIICIIIFIQINYAYMYM